MYISDLHIHSRFSRATSRELTPGSLDLWARKKGIHILGTGDFTHPAWRAELKEQLAPAEPGLYLLKKEFRIEAGVPAASPSPRFVITGEISSIYKKNGRVRKVHSLIILPSLEAADILSGRLAAIGNIHSDGRPILGLDCHDLLAMTLDACPEAIFVPAHIWTPHFSVFGAFSGFDSMEECFEELTPQIHAVETGLSSDPPMNWRLSALDGLQLISNSDAHSPAKLGREANLLSIPMSYGGLYGAIQRGEGLAGTIEFFPEEGKYHFDGHRKCHLCITPGEARSYGGICPVCGKRLTTGVLHRVEDLADRPSGFQPADARAYESLVPLPELMAAALGTSAASQKTARLYEHALGELGSEFHILRKTPLDDIRRVCGRRTAQAVERLRAGQVDWHPGYDGEYGHFQIFAPGELGEVEGQLSLTLEPEPALTAKEDGKKPEAAAPLAGTAGPAAKAAEPAARTPEMPAAHPGLNPAQNRALLSLCPVTAVTAGPGTGKTRTLVAKILHLLRDRGVKAGEITAVTFTRKAAAELKKRLSQELAGTRISGRIQTGTFHPLCFGLLKSRGLEFNLAEDSVREEAAEQAAQALSLTCSRENLLRWISLKKAGVPAALPLEGTRQAENSADTAGTGAANAAAGSDDALADAVLALYNEKLRAKGLLELDDLLTEALMVIQDKDTPRKLLRPFSYLLVDEFQDINPVQYRLIAALHDRGRELFVIGDPDQAIYGFRGADSQCFAHLLADYPKTEVIRLGENYRSTPDILAAATALISHNPGGQRLLTPKAPAGLPLRLIHAESSMEECIFIAKEISRMVGGMDMLEAHSAETDRPARSFSDIAVLYRTNRQAQLLEQCLRREDIPCEVIGREDYLNTPHVRRALLYFRELLSREPSFPGQDASVSPGESSQAGTDSSAAGSQAGTDSGTGAGSLKKERPWRLLEELASREGLSGDENIRQLIGMSYFHKTMEDMLEALIFGEEGDIARRTSPAAAPGGCVRLMTFHGSKGLEFPAVFLYGLKKGVLPLQSGENACDAEEERRLLYVAMTRAREELILTCSQEESPFLAELPPGNIKREKANKSGPVMRQLSLFDMGL